MLLVFHTPLVFDCVLLNFLFGWTTHHAEIFKVSNGGFWRSILLEIDENLFTFKRGLKCFGHLETINGTVVSNLLKSPLNILCYEFFCLGETNRVNHARIDLLTIFMQFGHPKRLHHLFLL